MFQANRLSVKVKDGQGIALNVLYLFCHKVNMGMDENKSCFKVKFKKRKNINFYIWLENRTQSCKLF